MNYSTIQEAIDANQTLNGDTIKVDAGTYYESITVNKSLTLVGEDRNITIIDGNWTGSLVHDPFGGVSESVIIAIEANDVSILNFTVRNAGFGKGHSDFHDCVFSPLVNLNYTNVENDTLQNADKGISFSASQANISNNDVSNMDGYGIDIGYSCTNVTVNDNHIQNCTMGINLDGDTHYCQIINNTVENGQTGIDLAPNIITGLVPSDNMLEGNIVANNSMINLDISAYGEFSANLGLQQGSFTNVFRRNNLTNLQNNLFVWGDSLSSFMQDIDSSNLANGKRIYYLTNSSGLDLDPSSCPNAGYLALVNCSNATVRGLDLVGNKDGMILAGSIDCILTNLTLGGNRVILSDGKPLYWGNLDFFESSNNTVENCVLCNGTYGTWLYHSNLNLFIHNSFINNDKNVFSGEASPAILSSGWISTNYWDNGFPSGGNYWSDYNGTDSNHDGIGGTPYVIDVNNVDHYPLMGMFNSFNVTSQCSVETICNSTISNFQFNGTAISFNVTGENGTKGFCRICIPTDLMNGTYTVFVNGTEVPYNLLPESNSTNTYLYFTYKHSTEQILIAPEFPPFLILPLFLIATLLTAMMYKKRQTRTT
jgi:parallel beta-helix repeat protein